jgi:hypothetical protein
MLKTFSAVIAALGITVGVAGAASAYEGPRNAPVVGHDYRDGRNAPVVVHDYRDGRPTQPPPRFERVRPRRGFMWVRGDWTYRHGRYVWVAGHWQRQRPVAYFGR